MMVSLFKLGKLLSWPVLIDQDVVPLAELVQDWAGSSGWGLARIIIMMIEGLTSQFKFSASTRVPA